MNLRLGGFKFQTLPTLITIPTFILLISLGCWQLQRLSDKEAKIKELQEKSTAPIISLPSEIGDIESFRYRKVRVTGEYIHDKEIFLYAGSIPGSNTDGFLILTPFKTTKNKLLLINRGWIPTNLKPQTERVCSLEPGIVDVTGYVMLGERKGWFTPENNDKKNIWFHINLQEMQKFVGAKLENYYIMRIYDGNSYPIGRNLNVNVSNNHLEYAITWFTSAFTLITIFFLYHRKHENK
jgi:surfeit locus 1 family protein